MPSQKKKETVEKISKRLEKAKSVFLTDYKGLTHQQIELLRKSLKKVKADYLIAKNRLLKLALKDWNAEALTHLEESLNNPTATLFAYSDEMSAVKTLADFIKTHHLPKIKMGFFEGKPASEKDFTTLAALPNRDILLAVLAARLQSPISGLHYAMSWNLQKLVIALNNIKGKKPVN